MKTLGEIAEEHGLPVEELTRLAKAGPFIRMKKDGHLAPHDPIFLRNKYFRRYCAIVAKAVDREPLPKRGNILHHIIPACFCSSRREHFGTVMLTYREHFKCHQ